MHLKLARDTLLDPAKRFAYDRFGPDVVEWQGVITLKEHVMYGLRGVAPFYAGSGLVLVLLGWFGFGSWGGYVSALPRRCHTSPTDSAPNRSGATSASSPSPPTNSTP